MPFAEKNNEDLNDVFCVIVLYKTTLQQSTSVNSLIASIKCIQGKLEVLLYNNSPEHKIDTSVLTNEKINFEVVNDETNPGVSRAYNLANSIALRKKKKWLFLLDQDTEIADDFFRVFFSERNKHQNDYKLYVPIIKSGNVIISPSKYFMYRGLIKKEVKTGKNILKDLAIINSGIIVNTALFNNAGCYNEDVGLDFSDVSFLRRVKKIYSLVFVLNVVFNHSFSGLDYDNYQNNLKRFTAYNINAIEFSKEPGVIKPLVFLQVLVRAIHLTMKFKTFSFLKEIRYS